MKYLKLPAGTVRNVLEYLESRPWGEVNHVMSELKANLAPVPDEQVELKPKEE